MDAALPQACYRFYPAYTLYRVDPLLFANAWRITVATLQVD
jgi:hypothetical protein